MLSSSTTLEMHTLFIATIALVAPFIPVEIEVLAYSACRKRDTVQQNEGKGPKTRIFQ
jgi:hypothetical protein